MILDPEKPLARMTDEEQSQLAERVRQDFKAAEDNREEREEIALRDYELYSRKRRDAEGQAADRGGWSKIEIPIAYWIVEHQVPRLGVLPPTITVKAESAEAVPYAQAKQMRLQHYLNTCGWDIPYQMICRSKLILGDGIAQVPWSPKIHGPKIMHVDWFDFFVSEEATVFEEAEVQFHRTFWSPSGLAELAEQNDLAEGTIWHNLADLPHSLRREQVDDTWERRRGITGQGSGAASAGHDGQGLPMISCWYRSGEYVVLGGQDHTTVLRAQMSPYRRRVPNPSGKRELEHLRPFAFFRNNPDLTGPYSISEPNVLSDHQVEMSTLRNQAIDAITMNLNSPIVHDSSIKDEDVDEAFSRPNGRLAVPWGGTGPMIQRMPPGAITNDLPIMYDQCRSEVQLVSGINDNAAGQPVNTQQTATEVSVLDANANKRIQLKRRMDEIAMSDVARMFDYRDRQFGTEMLVPVEAGFSAKPDALGFGGGPPGAGAPLDGVALASGRLQAPAADTSSGFATIGMEVNGPGMEYQVIVDAGSSVRPDQGEKAQEIQAFVAAASHPAIAPQVNWSEVTRHVIQTFGLNPDKLMVPPPPPLPPEPAGPDAAANGAAPPPLVPTAPA